MLLCCTLAFAPIAARAAGSGDPNDPLFGPDGNPCFELSKTAPTVSGSLSVDDPNEPGKTFFSHLPNCASLCKKVGASCTNFAKRAASCATRTAGDRANLEIKVTCQGFPQDPNDPNATPKSCAEYYR